MNQHAVMSERQLQQFSNANAVVVWSNTVVEPRENPSKMVCRSIYESAPWWRKEVIESPVHGFAEALQCIGRRSEESRLHVKQAAPLHLYTGCHWLSKVVYSSLKEEEIRFPLFQMCQFSE